VEDHSRVCKTASTREGSEVKQWPLIRTIKRRENKYRALNTTKREPHNLLNGGGEGVLTKEGCMCGGGTSGGVNEKGGPWD